jgi:hypothetical protein
MASVLHHTEIPAHIPLSGLALITATVAGIAVTPELHDMYRKWFGAKVYGGVAAAQLATPEPSLGRLNQPCEHPAKVGMVVPLPRMAV